ncbi:tryptophan halogenase family protein [Sphingomonas caeni]|uniref:tryptophan halogenase family protein n=1 Tax=Sphingomonas caeni TaxID=2984949 RepID=UPI0022324527|nr:tryptophan halogenase family protein [Sphingomonas caeni]
MKRVVIAGGGTAGWNVAAALGSTLGTLLDITLVESEEIGTIGVGESTVPTVRRFHQLLGIKEQEFMRDNRASFKLGISFEDWARIGDRYIHSFGVVGKSTWMGDFHHFWLHAVAQGYGGEVGQYCFEHEALRAGKFACGPESTINYAYHLDAALYARFLRKFSEGFGVRRVEGKITSVDQDGESGFVIAINLESGARIEGDLFIDCTGFRGLLIEQALGAGFEDWGQWLPCNSALPIQTRAVGPAVPYTRAMAHEAGWMWQIPLQHRVGNGFVYSSDHMSDEAAHDGLHARIEGEVVFAPKPIRFRAGRRLKTWDKNVVAFGLSSGFVEPLESTSIHLIQVGVTRLIQSFPFAGISQAQVDRYNARAQAEIEMVRDFVTLHYKLTEREDSEFWRYCKNMSIPDSLAARIALFRESGMAYQDQDELFRIDSWLQVMIGQRLVPQAYHHMGRLLTDAQLKQALTDLKTNIAGAVARMPAHQDFVDSYCGAEALA